MMMLSPRSQEALLCARACELVYAPFSSHDFINGLPKLGFSPDKTLCVEEAGIEAFVAVNDDVLLVCFRGTDSLPDWLADAMATKTPLGFKDHRVHTGFLRTMMVVEQFVRNFVDTNLYERHKLLITGHSLGAAMAVAYAARNTATRINGVVTFGSPRFGNEAFSSYFNRQFAGKSLRFVNNNDVVTRLPLKIQGYAHVHRLQYFDRRKQFHENYRPCRWQKFWDGLAGRLRNFARLRFGDGIGDHAMPDYRALVESLND